MRIGTQSRHGAMEQSQDERLAGAVTEVRLLHFTVYCLDKRPVWC